MRSISLVKKEESRKLVIELGTVKKIYQKALKEKGCEGAAGSLTPREFH